MDTMSKEKTHILQTWVVVVERRIVLFPSVDREFNQVVSAKSGVGDIILLLQEVRKQSVARRIRAFLPIM